MKRILSFLIALALLLGLTGCSIINTKSVTQEQAKKHFADYEKQLKTVLEPYHLTLVREEGESDDSNICLYRNYSIRIDDTSYMEVGFHTNAAAKDVSDFSEEGYERFSVDYYHETKKPFNTALFVDVVNTVTGRAITKEYCEAFLSDLEENYQEEKTSGEIVKKSDALNFWEDWCIDYTLYDDDREKLSFSGLTKEGTKKE